MTELLAPAGSLDSLRAAVNAGADAVYIGGSLFGARAYADNPGEADLISGIEYCHLRGRKLYLTVNTLLKEAELHRLLTPFLLPYYENGVDALIVQDLGVVKFVREHFPGLELHASTQMSITTPGGAALLAGHGISRVVPARELSLKEIRAIICETGLEVETFIHGAMCYSYSGQCLFSSMLGGRSGNRGRCAQPCRLPYTVERPAMGYDSPASAALGPEKEKGRDSAEPCYILSMKDMCTLDILPELLDAGIASFKIEGRMKRPEYTAGVVSVYRKYMDLYEREGRDGYHVAEEDRRILLDLYNRGGFSQGYYHMHNGPAMMSLHRPNHQGTQAARLKTVKGRTVQAVALEPICRGDVLETAPGSEITVGVDARCGDVFQFSLPPVSKADGGTKRRDCVGTKQRPDDGKRTAGISCRSGQILYRTKSEALLADLQKRFLKENCRVNINGDLRIYPNTPVILELWVCGTARGGRFSVEIAGDPPQAARTNAAQRGEVERQIRKTGDTPFVFDRLEVTLADGVFLPVRTLNELRRTALQQLQEVILQVRRERPPHKIQAGVAAGQTLVHETRKSERAAQKELTQIGGPQYRMNILVTTWEQMHMLLAWLEGTGAGHFLDTVYLDSMLLPLSGQQDAPCEQYGGMMDALRRRGIRCFLNCPPVMRGSCQGVLESAKAQGLLREMDGFLVHTVDQLSCLKRLSGHSTEAIFAAEDCLYAFNRDARALLRAEGISRFTLPAEQNSRELAELCGPGTELVVYGYQPLMQSAQCIRKNTHGCTGQPGLLFLKDRKGVRFPVLNRCQVCCNTIYNSVPLCLDGCRDTVKRLQPDWLRLSFTIEPEEEARRILERYTEVFFGQGAQQPEPGEKAAPGSADVGFPIRNGTRGHFKRGVE